MATMRTQAIRLGAVVLLAWSAPALGQATGGKATSAPGEVVPLADQVAKYVTDRLSLELKLTQEQVAKVEKINAGTAKTLKHLSAKYDKDTTLAGDRAYVRGIVTALRTNQAELKKVLTPAQWATHQQNKAERLALNQTDVMIQELKLTTAQYPDVDRINLDAATKLVAALDQPTGTPMKSTAERLKIAQPILQERDEALQKVLTVEQWAQMQHTRRILRELLVQQAATPVPPQKKT
jgi:hypothetical protein